QPTTAGTSTSADSHSRTARRTPSRSASLPRRCDHSAGAGRPPRRRDRTCSQPPSRRTDRSETPASPPAPGPRQTGGSRTHKPKPAGGAGGSAGTSATSTGAPGIVAGAAARLEGDGGGGTSRATGAVIGSATGDSGSAAAGSSAGRSGGAGRVPART